MPFLCTLTNINNHSQNHSYTWFTYCYHSQRVHIWTSIILHIV